MQVIAIGFFNCNYMYNFDIFGNNRISLKAKEVYVGINTIDWAKRRVQTLIGRNITLKVNKGRNKFVTYNGTITNAYPSIFTVSACENDESKIVSYSYSDILTKTVRFYPLQSEKDNSAKTS